MSTVTRKEFPAQKGTPPSIEQRPVHELQVDESYQRSTAAKESIAMIKKIASAWDWRLCAPLTVSRRVSNDGSPPRYFVIDGQHRLEAARLRGDIQFLPCIISTFDTIAEEAACFVSVNTARRAVTVLDKFRARLAAADPTAIAVARLIEQAGLKVAPHSNFVSWPPLTISCVGGVSGARSRFGEDVTLAALVDIATAFPSEQLRYAGRILQGVYLFRSSPPLDLVDSEFRVLLSKLPQSGWNAAMLRRQAKFGELPESAMQYALADAWSARHGR